jgi:8-oxo-dGTP pyrophosphatase MutT (NUDIX family)
MAAHPVFNFDHHSSIAEFAVSKRAYLSARPNAPFGYIATSTLVLDAKPGSSPRVLLLQRAASDEDPNKWEPPGGACDDDDMTILYAAARELWEEAGLEAAEIRSIVGDPYFFTLDDGKKVCQFNFAVRARANQEASLMVKLDPKEHQRFLWATKDEVKAKKVGDIDLDFTRDEVARTVLLVFKNFSGSQN